MKKILFFLLLILYGTPARPQTFHAFMFCKTKDKKIGKSVSINYANMHDELQTMADGLKYRYIEHLVNGNSFNIDNIDAVLKDASFGPDDIVVMYFSTHGAKAVYDSNIFPQLDIPDSLVSAYKKHNYMSSKKPKFLLTIIEACSGYLDITPQQSFLFEQSFMGSSRSELNPDEINNVKKLFNSSCEIIITAGNPGKNTWATSEGSMFTNCFLRAVNDFVEGDPDNKLPVTWSNVLERAKTYTAAMTRETSIYYYPVWETKECNGFSLQFIANLKDDAPRKVDFKVDTAKHFRLKNPYNVTLSIINKSDFKIDSVTYFLDKSFAEPIVTIKEGPNNFAYHIAAKFTFPTKAKIYFHDGKVNEIYKNVSLKTRPD